MSSPDAEPSRRRRQPGAGRRRPRNGKKPSEGEDGAAAAPARERPEPVPVPAELFGTTVHGVVSAIIRKGRMKFGYITIGDSATVAALAEGERVPRVYFNFGNLTDSNLTLRKGYPVKFLCSKDDKDRSFAANIELTDEGKGIAAAKEAEIAERRAAEAANPSAPATAGEGGENNKRAKKRRERKQVEGRKVTLKVVCDGKPEEKMIEFTQNQPMGRVKNIAITEFEAPVDYNVYHVTAEHPEGEFLTRAAFNKFTGGETIRIAPARETDPPKVPRDGAAASAV